MHLKRSEFTILAGTGERTIKINHALHRVCLDTMAPFRSPIRIALFFPFQTREKGLFVVETAAEMRGPIFVKQALRARLPVDVRLIA